MSSSDARDAVDGAARQAQDSTLFRTLARTGYAVLGMLHILIGLIAITIATGGGGSADQGGALAEVQKSSGGVVLLWIIVAGLFSLGIWQIGEAVLESDSDAKTKWAHRVKFLSTAITYFAIGATSAVFASGGQSQSSQSTTSFSADLLAQPAGVFLLVLVGIGVAAVGVAFVVRGIAQKFTKHLALPAGAARKSIIALGVAGYVAKGIAVAVTGILFISAALTDDAQKAGGLDAALRALAGLPYGPIILWVVGAGLMLYGVFCIARARYARM